jgi:hypothetical protein
MAENTVVKEQLTDAMIQAGENLTRKLDEAGVPVVAALWLFDTDLGGWRLVFATPDVDTKGPREVYRKIIAAIESLGPDSAAAPLSVIGLLGPNADLVRLLKVAIQTGTGISRVRFTRNVINGHFIDDALIYRAA